MKNENLQKRFNNNSPRAQWHDYNGGMYFITICTKDQKHYFGNISNGQMNLSTIGQYVNEQFNNISSHYPYAEIPLWVVMPNHLHCIIIIDEIDDFSLRPLNIKNIQNVSPEGLRETPRETTSNSHLRWKNNNVDEKMQNVSLRKGRLSTVVGGLKSAVTKFARKQNKPFVWQSGFFDHIIRNESTLHIIAKYIETNVAKWEYDRFHPG
ncbi:MAG: transposase [Bacteroidales bacterium]|nr:transposase [Bacteroidales bacterium]